MPVSFGLMGQNFFLIYFSCFLLKLPSQPVWPPGASRSLGRFLIPLETNKSLMPSRSKSAKPGCPAPICCGHIAIQPYFCKLRNPCRYSVAGNYVNTGIEIQIHANTSIHPADHPTMKTSIPSHLQATYLP